MDEETQEMINNNLQEIILWTKESAKATSDFVTEQAPLVVQEMIAWGIFENGFYAALYGVLGLACIIMVVFCIKRFRRQIQKINSSQKDCNCNDYEYCENCKDNIACMYMVIGSISGIASLFLLIACIDNFMTCMYIYFAPRLYILDELSRYING